MRDLPQKGGFYLTYGGVIRFLNTFASARKVRVLLIGLKEKSIISKRNFNEDYRNR